MTTHKAADCEGCYGTTGGKAETMESQVYYISHNNSRCMDRAIVEVYRRNFVAYFYGVYKRYPSQSDLGLVKCKCGLTIEEDFLDKHSCESVQEVIG